VLWEAPIGTPDDIFLWTIYPKYYKHLNPDRGLRESEEQQHQGVVGTRPSPELRPIAAT